MNEGDPIEHSDKWGKISKPYSVSLPQGLPKIDIPNVFSIEFFSKGELAVGGMVLHDDEWTHYCL